MKKIIFCLFIVAAWCGNAFSAGTCAHTATDRTDGSVILVTLTFTADATNAAGTAWTCSPETVDSDLDGAYIYQVFANPGDTGPTDLSDLAVTDAAGLTPFSATGHGLNFIDNTTNTAKWTEDEAGNDWAYPVSKENPITWTITNNSVNSAVTVVTIFADRVK